MGFAQAENQFGITFLMSDIVVQVIPTKHFDHLSYMEILFVRGNVGGLSTLNKLSRIYKYLLFKTFLEKRNIFHGSQATSVISGHGLTAISPLTALMGVVFDKPGLAKKCGNTPILESDKAGSHVRHKCKKYLKANANANASADSFRLRLHFTLVNRGNANAR